MSKFWKNAGNALIIFFISGGVAAGVASFVVKNYGNNKESSNEHESIFKQPVHYASLNTIAAENIDFTFAAEKSVNAVVHIYATSRTVPGRNRNPNSLEEFFGFGDRQRTRPRASGSGVIISTDGYIMTANHVIDGADTFKITLNDKRTFYGKLVGGDAETDIALLKIEAEDLQPIPFGDSNNLKVGEWVLAVGNPFELTSTVTAGIVSAKGRPNYNRQSANDERNSEINRISSFIQTDAVVNPGNSGGALVNTRGELVGINTMIYSQTGTFAGYSFAVPISTASRVVSDLKEYGILQRAALGVIIGEPDKDSDPKIKTLEGAYVKSFSPNSSAKNAGIEVGDIITAINDVKVTSVSSLQEQVMKHHVGEKVKVTLNRYGTVKDITVELKNMQGTTDIVKVNTNSELLGATFRTLNDSEKEQYRIRNGIEVTNVTRGKFRDRGISNGFVIIAVNDHRINTPDELFDIVEKIMKGDEEEKGLFIRGFYPRTGSTRHYAIDLVD